MQIQSVEKISDAAQLNVVDFLWMEANLSIVRLE